MNPTIVVSITVTAAIISTIETASFLDHSTDSIMPVQVAFLSLVNALNSTFVRFNITVTDNVISITPDMKP